MKTPVSKLIVKKFSDGTVRRFLFVAAVAFWLGGFMFYGGVVIEVGAKVLGSHRKQGFITQQVTDCLNVAGAVALPIILWNAMAVWGMRGRLARFLLAATWVTMAAIQIELFALHPVMDRLLDAKARTILDDERFDALHVVYLTSSTVQWAAGVIHVWCAVGAKEC
jgi:hypothetical protein